MTTQIIPYLITIILTALVIIFVTGCSTVGKSKSTLIRTVTNDDTALELFPQYTTSHENKEIVALDAGSVGEEYIINNFMTARYDSERPDVADLSFTIRDRTKLPPFVPIDSIVPSKLFDLYASEGSLSTNQRIELENLISARLHNVPDLISRTALHHMERSNNAEQKVFYNYPRLYFDFSASLSTHKVTDRFSYLAVAVVLRNPSDGDTTESQVKNSIGDHVRFVDFSPKDADLVEYTRGTLTQAATLNAKGTFGESGESSKGKESTVGPETDSLKTTKSSSSIDSIGAELAYTLSDTYVNELRDAFERRTTGIFDKGQVFVAEFRAISEKRIGGTYSFDLMMEVPADVTVPSESKFYQSMPIQEEVIADVYLLGVVRHIYERGQTGILIRVPEPSNDTVFEQVIFEKIPNIRIWKHNGQGWGDTVLSEELLYTVSIHTNQDEAKFIIRDVNTKEIIGAGSGSSDSIEISPDESVDITARVEFLEVVIESGGNIHRLNASDSPNITIPSNQAGSSIQVGKYQ